MQQFWSREEDLDWPVFIHINSIMAVPLTMGHAVRIVAFWGTSPHRVTGHSSTNDHLIV